MKIAITGHRPNKLGNDYDLTSPLIGKIKNALIHYVLMHNSKDLELITGMALGIDTLFALIAIEYSIPFIAAIPCKNQTERWPIKSITRYTKILSGLLCTVHYVSDKMYTPSCMQKRNEWMVDNCDILIAVWDGSAGGTANCIKYAKDKKEIIYINPLNL